MPYERSVFAAMKAADRVLQVLVVLGHTLMLAEVFVPAPDLWMKSMAPARIARTLIGTSA